MAFLKMFCGSCKQKWDVYARQMNEEESRVCPHCGAEIDRQTWKNQIVPALGQVADANRELMKDHLGYHSPAFSFDVIEDTHINTLRLRAERKGGRK